ncbi:MAG: trypsin-like peptidase domain-containing protein [Solirubrobacterales bacterium]|nr:trypsin-like peptidase domain-containing protein [Solirubrobacterales bacterium]
MRRLAPPLAVLTALALAACGSSGGDSADRSGRTETVERNTRVEVVKQIGEKGGFDPVGIYEREAPGVVTVFSVLGGGGGLLGGDEGGQGVGSGFVVDEGGEIATNAHVVTAGEGGDIRRAREVYVAFADGNQVPAKIVGFDPNSDVALLKIDPEGLTLRPLPLGTTRELAVGSPVAAIGSPFGEPQSLSVGVVSATDRAIESLTGFQIVGAIQTDAAINRGNSGGPLVNAKGRVLGINSQIRSTSGGGEGVGYAVPVDTVRRVLSELRDDGKIEYSFLGVSTTQIYPQLAERFDLPVRKGAWVQEVVDGGPAEKAGLRAGDDEERFQARTVSDGGDIITEVEGTALDDEADLSVELLRFEPGEEVTLEVYRDGERRKVDVTLGKRPEQTGRPRARP